MQPFDHDRNEIKVTDQCIRQTEPYPPNFRLEIIPARGQQESLSGGSYRTFTTGTPVGSRVEDLLQKRLAAADSLCTSGSRNERVPC